MISRSADDNSFEFVRIAALRAAQLLRGCVARVPAATKAVITAQREVAAGLVHALPRPDAIAVAAVSGAVVVARPRTRKPGSDA